MKRICAWCKEPMGEIAPEQPGVTHGICEKCKANLLAEKDGQFRARAVSSPPYNRPAHFEGIKCK